MTLQKAIQELERIVQAIVKVAVTDQRLPTRVAIECWPTDNRSEYTGIRVSEVCLLWEGEDGSLAGAAWMQSNGPEALAVCAYAERVLIWLLEGDETLLQEEVESLAWAMYPTLVGRPLPADFPFPTLH